MGLIQYLNTNPQLFIILSVSIIFSFCIHEFSHAFVAYKCGDDTAARLGRLSLNPLRHLDPVGTLMIFFAGFGWAKPVPVNPTKFNNFKNDTIKVALAGPLSNFALALICSLLIRPFLYLFPSEILEEFFIRFIFINIVLTVINLIPAKPFDGGEVFSMLFYRRFPSLIRIINKYQIFVILIIYLFSSFLIFLPSQILILILSYFFGYDDLLFEYLFNIGN